MPSTDVGRGAAEILFRGGPIYTFDDAQPRAGALAVRGNRILALGDAAGLDVLSGHGTRVVDLEGRALLPGFIDAHVHFASFARSRREVDLDPAATIEQGLAMLDRASASLPPDAWLFGRGWDRNRWGRLPTAEELDRAIGPRRAVLASHDEHSQWVSSTVLALAGISENTPHPEGGRIERLPDGRPSGVLFENAQSLVDRIVPEPSVEETARSIRDSLPLAAQAGITGIHNFEGANALRAFTRLRDQGELTLRVFHGLPREHLRSAVELGLQTGFGNDWLRVGLVKLFADGALGSRTAYVMDPYEGRDDGYRGIPTLSDDELRQDLIAAARGGLGVATHAIGDAAVRSVLDAIEWARSNDAAARRALFRVEHAQLVHPDDFKRFAQLNVIASMQPIHAAADWRTADQHWGARARWGYAWRSMLDAGASLAFGTDAPVERIEPLLTLYAAVSRKDLEGQPERGWHPEQRVSLHQALRAYTIGAAHAEGADAQRGSLVAGKLADLAVLSRDPFGVEPAELLETHVDMTVAGGRIVHER